MGKQRSALRREATRLAKPLELFGRRLLQYLLALVLRAPKKAARLTTDTPRILVVRLDARVGNLMLLTPFLRSVRATWPQAHLTVLCHESMRRVYAHVHEVDALIPYVKWRVGAGPVSLLRKLRAQRFDLAFDAGSHPGVAVTHPLIARLCGAALVVGPDRGALAALYNIVAPALPEDSSDIAQRLALLSPFPGVQRVQQMRYADDATFAALAKTHAAFVAEAAPAGPAQTLLCVVGARLSTRRIPDSSWQDIVAAIRAHGLHACIVWGPGERETAERIAAATGAVLAPPSSLDALAVLCRHARGVIGHDTGTSHVAVAADANTFVLFVLESPARYGHAGPHQTFIDLRQSQAGLLPALDTWLDGLIHRRCQ